MSSRLYPRLDWFVPSSLKGNSEIHRRARMFVVSHLLGTPLGYAVVAYLYLLDPAPSAALWLIAAAVTAFFFYPFALKFTGRFHLLALLSVQHLAILVLVTSYEYGGANSPFLPWLLAAPIAAYFYFGARARLRSIVLTLLALDLLAFFLVYAIGIPFPNRLPPSAMFGIGVFSVFSAAAYVSMLSFNYANIVMQQQRDLEREVARRSDIESALRQAKDKAEHLGASFRLLFADNPIPMWVYEIETLRFLEVNDAAIAQYGYSREQFLAMTIDQIRPPEDAPSVRVAAKDVRTHFGRAGVWRHRKADGSDILVDVLWHQLEFQGRRAAIVAAIDVTEQTRAEDALRESEGRFRQILDTAYDAFISIDAHGIINAWNIEAERIFGWSAQEAIGRDIADLTIPERFRESHVAGLRAFRETGEAPFVGRRIEHLARRRDGSERLIELTIAQMRGKNGPIFNAFIHDITERKEREWAIRESEARYRLLAENATDIITRVALDRTRLYVSPAVREVLGYAPEELIGKPITDLPHPDDRIMVDAAIAALSRGDSTTVTLRSRHKNGAYVWLESSLRLVRDPATGKPSEVLAVSRNVTARQMLQEQLAAAKEQAEHASRAKSEFLANMSHELRTPLNAIMGFGDLIENQRLGPLGNVKYAEYGHDIVESGRHLLDLINEILDFAKVDAGRLTLAEETVDIHAVIQSCVHMLAERAAHASLTIETRLGSAIEAVRGDERRLKQILLNLVSNSIKFTPPGGRVVLDTRIEPGGGLVIRVADTGIGIAAKDIHNVLEPFGQVDSAFNRRTEGTGLGLPLSKRLVEMHGGTLELESAPGIGTTATVRLPAERVLKNVA